MGLISILYHTRFTIFGRPIIMLFILEIFMMQICRNQYFTRLKFKHNMSFIIYFYKIKLQKSGMQKLIIKTL